MGVKFARFNVLFFLSMFGGGIHAKPIEIQKVFHHISGAPSHHCRADALVFYSTSAIAPRGRDIYVSPTIRRRIYTLPAVISDSELFSRFPFKSSLGYSVTLTSKRSIIECSIEYDTTRIAVAVSSCMAVKDQKSLVFHFFDRTPAQQVFLSTERQRVVLIDCGHGGTDVGALGTGTGVCEKDVTLAVGKQLKVALESRGFKVLMTRIADVTRTLDERTFLANQCAVDLVVSLHANYAPRPQVRGVETYSLSRDVHCFKNLSDPVAIPALRTCINTRSHCGQYAARLIHAQLVSVLAANDTFLVNRGTKQAISQLLLGIEAPTILIEMGFLSNAQEEQLLTSCLYQRNIVEGICRGIQNYFGKSSPA